MTAEHQVRYFEFQDEKSAKFWEVTQIGSTVMVRFGKQGTNGQRQEKKFLDEEESSKHVNKLIKEKTGKGYVEKSAMNSDASIATDQKRSDTPTPIPEKSKSSNKRTSNKKSTKIRNISDTQPDDQSPPSLMEAPEEYQELSRMMGVLQEKLAVAWPDGEDEVAKFQEIIQSGRRAFKPETIAKPADEIDRLGNVIMGPLFSSQEFPWPWAKGSPLSPLLQIDLAEAGELGNIDLGSGLLQVWLPKDPNPAYQSLCRVIPPEAIKRDLLEDIPPFKPADDYFQTPNWALNERDRIGNLDGLCYQIVGWAEKFTTQLYGGNFGDFELGIPEDVIDEESQLILNNFKSILNQFERSWSPSRNHLFGTFYPIQYKWNDRPLPLFCFDGDSEHGTAWGDGNAQVFFERKKDGGLKFSFEWSCY